MGLRVIGATSLYKQGMDRRGRLMFMKNLHRRIATPRAIATARVHKLIPDDDNTLVDSIATPSNAHRSRVESSRNKIN